MFLKTIFKEKAGGEYHDSKRLVLTAITSKRVKQLESRSKHPMNQRQ